MRGVAPGIKPLHHYSTTEQIVGTWIDGKPIYELTASVSKQISGGGISLRNEIIDVIDDIDNLISASANRDKTHANGSGCCSVVVSAIETYEGLRYVDMYSSTAFNATTVTIQYTKTTDTVPSA